MTTGTTSKSFFTGAGMEKRSLTRDDSFWPGACEASASAASWAVFGGMEKSVVAE